MGAGVSTNPHFPRVRLRCRLGHAHPPLADQVQTRALRPLPVPSRVPIKHCCLAVPCRVPGGYRYPARFPFCSSAARKLRSRWTVRKVGAALAFALPHASSSLALPIASTTFILADVRRLGGGSDPRPSTVAGRPPLATRRSCHPLPSRTNENRLWIRCITGISSRLPIGERVPPPKA